MTTVKGIDINQEIYDQAVLLGLRMNSLQGREVRSILRFLDRNVLPDLERKLERAIRNLRSPYTQRRIAEQLASVRAELDIAMGNMTDELRARLDTIATTAVQAQGSMLSGITQTANISWALPTPGQMRAIVETNAFQGRTLSGWAESISTRAQAGIMQQVRIGMTEGESIPNIVNRIVNTREGGSVFRGVRRNASAVTRTAVSEVNSSAREALYEENSDIIGGVQYIATLDDRTTIICASLDGRIFKVSEGPRPPMHINCRSTTAPVLKPWDKMPNADAIPEVARPSLTGSVPSSTDYPTWLKRQPKGIQVEVLGSQKAEWFRKGELSIDDMISRRTYEPYSISALRKKYDLS